MRTCALNHSKKFIKVPKKEKSREILLHVREENSLSNSGDDYGTLSSVEISSHSIGRASEPDFRKCGMKEETAHQIVCGCPAIKYIRVRLYGKPLLLPEEVMEEPLLKIARFASETGLLN